ncbi:hypothetical protein BKA56DRAFT_611673 [Ilyonectria sp. MPI-CAGE-AT-0026]|nr:hypothetical protein BKA56DRAFT_611673 [Ilyonectria sp. MPI-CAGE-AT-0026]
MMLQNEFSVFRRCFSKVGRLLSIGSGRRGRRTRPHIDAGRFGKSPKMEKGELGRHFRAGDWTREVSQPVTSRSQQPTVPEYYMRGALATAPVAQQSFRERMIHTRLGRSNEALGSHPVKQPSPLKSYSFTQLGRRSEALGPRPTAQPSLRRRDRFKDLAGRGLVDNTEVEEDNWSTMANLDTGGSYNSDSSEQDFDSEESSDSEPDSTQEESSSSWLDWSSWSDLGSGLGLSSWPDLSEGKCLASELCLEPDYTGKSNWESDMIEPMTENTDIAVKPKSVSLPPKTTEQQLEDMKTQVSTWRTKCDTLRGENSDLQRLVDGMRWVCEDYLELGPNDRVTGAQASFLAEEMKERLRWYERKCPQLRDEYDTVEKQNLEATAEIKRELKLKMVARAKKWAICQAKDRVQNQAEDQAKDQSHGQANDQSQSQP